MRRASSVYPFDGIDRLFSGRAVGPAMADEFDPEKFEDK